MDAQNMGSAPASNDIPEVGLTVVYEPESTSPNLDVVFVHGFTGSPYKTWTHHGTDDDQEPPPKSRKIGSGFRSRRQAVFWPRDLLPSTLPGARVMTYGYNTHLTLKYIGNPLREITLYDIAKDLLLSLERCRRQEPCRPIMFISHSLGGLVVKDMLRYADHNKGDTLPHLTDLIMSTVGLMFFSTPHLGADPRSLFHRQVEGIARLVLKVNDNIVRTLRPNSENARRLQDEFVPLVQKQKWTVHSFQEAYNNRVLGKQVVDHMSSCLGIGPPLETTEDINRDHSEMCRFTGLGDTEYQKVVSALQRITVGLATRPQRRNGGARTLSEEERQALLDSLRFDQIDNRLQSVKAAYAATCRWFTRHPAYLDWQDPEKASEIHGFLWVKGKPGAGKSTLMKFALANHRKEHGDENIASFFFNARGTELEKTTTGMYRSLIVQLLEMLPRLRCAFDDAGLKPWNALGGHHWSLELLKEVFGRLVQSLEPSERVTCFIDALDECSRDEIRDMVGFFEGLMADQGVDQGTFRVVFSSRHYPQITTSRAVNLVLETQEEHSSDIKNYVVGRLQITLREDVRDQIVLRIEEKASGVFMWVVLVVDILNKAHLDGRPPSYFRKKLEELPGDLHELFRDMLMRDKSDKHELLLCLQWIFFARRPLSPDELYCGILAGTEPQMLGEYDTGNEGVKRFILNASKGLVEVVEVVVLNKKNTIVQFIHESVRDFLIKGGGLKTLWPNLGDDFSSQSHDALKDCCLAYINLNIPEPETDPFLQYAVRNVLWHADNAAAGGICQGKFLEEFPRERWVTLHNLHEKHKNRHFRLYSMNVTLMYILAEAVLGALIKTHMAATGRSGLEWEEERFCTPLFVARANQGQQASLVILQEITRRHPNQSELEQLCQQFIEEKPTSSNWWEHFQDRTRRQRKAGSLWYTALEAGDSALCDFLFTLDQLTPPDDIHSQCDNFEWMPLHLAAKFGAVATVKLLLKIGMRHRPRAGTGSVSAPKAASIVRRKTLDPLPQAEVTIDALVNAENKAGETPLGLASRYAHPEVVQLLIEAGAAIESKTRHGETPLYLAAHHWYGESKHMITRCFATIQVLLEAGANIHARSARGTALHSAASAGNKSAVELLLQAGASPDIKTNGGCTPLHNAASSKSAAVLSIPLQGGSDAYLEAKDNLGNTPLLLAANSPWGADTVQVLLDAGADKEARDNDGNTPLLRAAGQGRKYAVQILLDAGADKEARDLEGATALIIAASSSDTDVVGTLLKAGLDIEARDHQGRTALMRAARYIREVMVKCLVQAGANASAIDRDGWTALDVAEMSEPTSSREHERKTNVVQFLRERTRMVLE